MAEDSHDIDYLFDFVYLDRERIASHFAQLFPEGTLTTVKTAVSDGDQSNSDLQGTLGLVKANLKHGFISSETLERQYDAAWTLPITLANRLDELGFLHRELESTPVGQLVLLSGGLQIIDIRMLQNMWDPLAKMMEKEQKPAGNRSARRAVAKAPQPQQDFNADIAQMMKLVPHALQMNFKSGESYLWATLDPAHMTVQPDDFALKHGSIVPGKWSMIGVLDSRPDHLQEDDDHSLDFLLLASMGGGLTSGLMDLLNNLRGIVGRPPLAYGITPLMLFRKVEASR